MKRDHYTISDGRLKRKDNTLYFIKGEDGTKQSLPIEQIRNIHVFGEVDFNTKLLNFISQFDICLHIYNYYGYYSGTYYPKKKNVSGFTVVHQSAHYMEHSKRIYLAGCFYYLLHTIYFGTCADIKKKQLRLLQISNWKWKNFSMLKA